MVGTQMKKPPGYTGGSETNLTFNLFRYYMYSITGSTINRNGYQNANNNSEDKNPYLLHPGVDLCVGNVFIVHSAGVHFVRCL
jgi:hypothetical protein